ncbi:MAG TPA: delta-60 repeat domain-containing protein [Dokdonella sp.]|nr:delta-60 repeat domain-containing protein [Dokdonella sp.]
MTHTLLRFACSAALLAAAAPAFAADGDLDPTFGTGGLALAGIADAFGGATACKPVLQPDGKILTCGTRQIGSSADFFVVRFTADGQLDPTFSFDGKVTIDFTGANGTDQATALALQSDGKIVVAGNTNPDRGSGHYDFAVARLDADGTLDTTFGAGTGKKVIAFDLAGGTGNDNAADVALQSDGRIVVAGSVATTGNGSDIGIARLLTDGSPDASFNLNGKVSFGFDLVGSTTKDDIATRVAIDHAGRIVVAGAADAGADAIGTDFAVARVRANGTLDPDFDADGRATVAFDVGLSKADAAFGLAIDTDDSIALSGNVDVSPSMTANQDIGIVKLLPDGSPDTTFGVGGKTIVTFDETPNGLDFGLDVAIRDDGRLVIAGAAAYSSSNLYGALVRLLANGDLDAGFGTLGRRSYDFGLTTPSSQAFLGLTLAGDAIYAGGIAVVSDSGSEVDVFIARMNEDTIFADGFDGA